MALPQEHAPVHTPLPAPPSKDWMDDAGWELLYALFDGCLPSIAPASASKDKTSSITLSDAEFNKALDEASKTLVDSPDKEALTAFLQYRPSENPKFREDALRTLSATPQRGQLAKVMGILASHPGSLLLTGNWKPLTQQPVSVRQSVLKSWNNSKLAPLRGLAKTVATVAEKANAISSPYFNSISGYHDVPKNWKAVQGFDYTFTQLPKGDGVHEITTDVIVVGSGCGGGVTAKNLSEAGHKVIVVDKGYYFPPSQLPMTQDSACNYLYDNSGIVLTEDTSTGIVSGSTWGGGGTVNWSVCLKPQDFVRQEWANEGLPLFTSKEFDESIDRVWKFVGASRDGIRHNHRNQAMLDAIEKLAWKGGVCDQNTAGEEHYCGHCHLGCGSAEKKGPAQSWLPAAAQNGAEFFEGFQVDKVLFGSDGVTAIGIEGVWTSRGADDAVDTPTSERTQRKVVIKAKKVVVSAGSIWSPVVLAKSGIKNPNVGRHLHLHPVNFVTAEYAEDVASWEGGIITSYINEFENLDGKGHGVKLEPTCMLPYTCYAMQPWTDGLDAKILQLKYRHLDTFISLTRDRDTGRVFVDPASGKPRVDYTISDFDREHTMEGVIALAKVSYVTGARVIRVNLPDSEPFVPSYERNEDGSAQKQHVTGTDPEFTDPAFAKWLKKVRKASNKPPGSIWTSAHQMGSCRMSAKEDTGVVDPKGLVWGTKNLYVADASVFPSASGVNPMITLMSIADYISRGIAKDLQKE